jgi:hypothetical protein
MPASPEFFALELTTELVAEQLKPVLKWIQLRKAMIDACPGCPGPDPLVIQKSLVGMSEVLNNLTRITTTIVQREVVSTQQAAE